LTPNPQAEFAGFPKQVRAYFVLFELADEGAFQSAHQQPFQIMLLLSSISSLAVRLVGR
jgi:hypothetical protein